MIQINNITINKNAEKLIIDAQIISSLAYENCYLKKIYIDTQDSYLSSGPSEDTVYEHDITFEDAKDEYNSTIEIDQEEKVRKLYIEIPQEAICASLRNNFFIVYIEAAGEADTTKVVCCDLNPLKIGCVLWMQPLYSRFLAWIREIDNTCEIPVNYNYFFLQYHGLITSIRTCNIMEAIRIYNKYIRNNNIGIGNSHFHGCNCKK